MVLWINNNYNVVYICVCVDEDDMTYKGYLKYDRPDNDESLWEGKF